MNKHDTNDNGHTSLRELASRIEDRAEAASLSFVMAVFLVWFALSSHGLSW